MSCATASVKASNLPKTTTKAVERPLQVALVQDHEEAILLNILHCMKFFIEGKTQFTRFWVITQPYQLAPNPFGNYDINGELAVVTRWVFETVETSPRIQYIVREITPFKHGKICIKSQHHSDVTISLDKSNATEMYWDGGNFMHTVQVELNKWSGQEEFLEFSVSYRHTRST